MGHLIMFLVDTVPIQAFVLRVEGVVVFLSLTGVPWAKTFIENKVTRTREQIIYHRVSKQFFINKIIFHVNLQPLQSVFMIIKYGLITHC